MRLSSVQGWAWAPVALHDVVHGNWPWTQGDSHGATGLVGPPRSLVLCSGLDLQLSHDGDHRPQGEGDTMRGLKEVLTPHCLV